MAIGIRVYRLRIYPINKRKKIAFALNGELDAWSMLNKYFEQRKSKVIKLSSYETNPAKQIKERRSLLISKYFSDKASRTFYGSCQVGEYGVANNIRNVDSGNISYKKTRADSDMPPYFFRIAVPDGVTSGVLLCGTNGVHSPKGPLERDLKAFFNKLDYTVKVSALMDAEAVKEYLANGAVPKELEVYGTKQTTDSREIMAAKLDGKELEAGSQLRVSVKESVKLNSMISKISKAFGDEQRVRNLVEIPGFEDFDVARVHLKNADGNWRWFNLVKPGESGLSYDVSADIKTGTDGHPTLSSMNRRGKAIIDEIKNIAFLTSE